MATKKNPDELDLDTLFTPSELKDFIRFFEKIDIAEVEITSGDKSLILSKKPRAAGVTHSAPAPVVHAAHPAPVASPAPVAAPAPAAAPAAKPKNIVEITSPIVGTLYRSPDPKSPAFVNVGDTIAPGKTICLIEAMKIFNEIKSEVSGVVKEILVENEQPVEFGQVIFVVETK